MSTYSFYNGTVELEFDDATHTYYREINGVLVPQPGVTHVCHILDHSVYLMPWACKMMAVKLFRTMPTKDGLIPQMPWGKFVQLVEESKNARTERFEHAADIGNLAHDWLQTAIQAAIDENDGIVTAIPELENEQAQNCARAALDWMEKHNVRWLKTERKIYSKQYGFAGTMDGLATVDSCTNPICCPRWFIDELSIIDWKTSNYLQAEYLYQTAAYQHAYQEEFGADIDSRWILRLGKEDGKFEPWYETDFEQDFAAFLACLELYKMHKSVDQRLREAKKLKTFTKREEKKNGKSGRPQKGNARPNARSKGTSSQGEHVS